MSNLGRLSVIGVSISTLESPFAAQRVVVTEMITEEE